MEKIHTIEVVVRCYAELNDHLPEAQRQRDFTLEIGEGETVRGVVALLGIPESEVDAALRNGEAVAADARLAPGDRLALYPVFESFDISGAATFSARPLRTPRFILDVHLGKLAAFMRMMGYDAMYQPGFNDDELVSISVHEGRALLSKDRRLLEHKSLTRAYHVNATDPKEQLIEVLARFHLEAAVRPFTRCLICNTPLGALSKADAAARVPDRVREAFSEFFRCPYCDKVYWKGSHYRRMGAFIDEVLRTAARLA